MGVAHFEELVCWQLANELKLAVYAIVDTPDVARDRDFCDDIRRSARSAPANISEGFGCFTHRGFARYLSIAYASLRETENHLLHLRELRLLPEEQWQRLSNLDKSAQKKTSRLRTYLLKTPDRRWTAGRNDADT
jgi:four helix bundle protein